MLIWTLTLIFVLVSMRTLTRGYNLFWLQVLTSFKLNSQFIGRYELPAHSINGITSLQPTILTCPLGQAQDFVGEYLLKCRLQSLPPRSPQSTGEEETHSSISNHATREAGSSILQMTGSWRQASVLDQSGKEHPCRPEPQTETRVMDFIGTSELNMWCQINQQLRDRRGRQALRWDWQRAQYELMRWHISHVTCPFTVLSTHPPSPSSSRAFSVRWRAPKPG